MTKFELKRLIREVIDEAVIIPDEAVISQVREILTKYFKDKKELGVKKMDNEMERVFSEVFGEDLLDSKRLNTILPPDIKFNPFLGPVGGAYRPKDDTVVLNGKYLLGEEGGIENIINTLGHELVHREQYRRGMKKATALTSRISNSKSEAEYFNNPIEVMAWGYTIVKEYVENNPNATFQDIIRDINTDDHFKKFLKAYDEKYKKKVLRYVVDYAQKLLKSA